MQADYQYPFDPPKRHQPYPYMHMNQISNLLLFLILLPFIRMKADNFQQYFEPQTCRIDFHFSGNAHHTAVSLYEISREPHWGGRQAIGSQFMNRGDYRFVATDSITGKILYSDGFNSLFREWQTTAEATNTERSFSHTLHLPFPKQTLCIKIQQRKSIDEWTDLNTFFVNPSDPLIRSKTPPAYPIRIIYQQLPTSQAVDIAILAEGYTARERAKFYRDAKTLADRIRAHEPFRSHATRLNFYAVAAPSLHSGISRPHEGKWLQTAFGSHYHTFYSERYLMTPEVFKVMDAAAAVPFDVVYILANTTHYGGGGIYNYYALTAANGRDAAAVAVHEFGHSFAGLADEYFREGWDALDQTYQLDAEPWEPNITTLKQFDRKWASSLPTNTEIPTPMPTDSTLHQSTTHLGVFEGAGYQALGIYRPTPDCRMKTNRAPEFCPVCTKAVEERILWLTKQY